MKKLNIREFKSTIRQTRGLEVEGDDGQTWTIDPPELWPDAAQELAKSGDNIGLVTLLLGGPEPYAAFVASGGSAAMVGQMIQDGFGSTAGE